jgi:hypothetical protein
LLATRTVVSPALVRLMLMSIRLQPGASTLFCMISRTQAQCRSA